MKTIEAKVPDYLARLTSEVAEREKVSVDQIVALALSAQVEAWRIRDDMETRALRANPVDFDALLDKVPDVPPIPGDEL
jgi:hypothetical protein